MFKKLTTAILTAFFNEIVMKIGDFIDNDFIDKARHYKEYKIA